MGFDELWVEMIGNKVSALEDRLELLEKCQPSPKQYRDVTAECEFRVGRLMYGQRVVTVNDGYRVRKLLVRSDVPIHEQRVMWAFIIEKEAS